jgi:uncharacterized protein DUF1549/uncharacterized protein DUF1553
MTGFFRNSIAVLTILTVLASSVLAGQQIEVPDFKPAPTAADCTYLKNPDQFQFSPELHQAEISRWTEEVGSQVRYNPVFTGAAADAAPSPMPRKNFIDDYIFGRLERDGIQPAPLSSDFEFLRRVYFDLTGRPPSTNDVYNFIADTNPNKRDALIDKLAWTYEFNDKWTMFFGDLFRNTATSSNITRGQQGRDAFYSYIYQAVAANKPYDEMARDLIAGEGDSFTYGNVNWLVGTTVAMGPAQDTYDGGAVNAAQMFLGINVADCLLCHDGARHLDSLNVWGKSETRLDMQGLSAFFARTRMTRQAVGNASKYIVSQVATGDYTLNTNSGNRQPRVPIGSLTMVRPKYPWNSGKEIAANADRLKTLATTLTGDIQFSRAAVNYIWEQFMVEPFVSPSNAFDLARLDPQNPPPAPWKVQPTNPELLQAMAQWFQQSGYNIRLLMMTITKSNAYQLSSSYPGQWKPDYVPYYARKYVRRLKAEEIHDAIVTVTGIQPSYSMDYQGSLWPWSPITWAMKFPDTSEPRSNGTVAQFLNTFGRGNRDGAPRDGSGSVLQALNMMNHSFVLSRIHNNNAGSNVQYILRATTNQTTIVDHLFVSTLSRPATPDERAAGLAMMRSLGTQRAAEDIQWALLNKLEFIFNY